jgi:uncharacterized protein YlxP (DUF503 family)
MLLVDSLLARLAMEGNHGLKDKRRIVKSLLGRVRARFNVSASEVGEQDSVNVAELGFTVCGSEQGAVDEDVRRLVRFIESDVNVELLDWRAACPASREDLPEGDDPFAFSEFVDADELDDEIVRER